MRRKQFFAVLIALAATTAPISVFAFSPPEALPLEADLYLHEIIDIVLGVFWSLTVLLVIVYFASIGFLFLTSKGDPDRLAQADSALRVGFIGVVVIIVAFSIVSIVRNTVGL